MPINVFVIVLVIVSAFQGGREGELTRRCHWQVPCYEEASTHELHIPAGVSLAIRRLQHRREDGAVAAAAFQIVLVVVARSVETPSQPSKRVVTASRLDEPQLSLLLRRRRLGAVVEDEVEIGRADCKRDGQLGEGVKYWDTAVSGAIQASESMDIKDEQSTVPI